MKNPWMLLQLQHTQSQSLTLQVLFTGPQPHTMPMVMLLLSLLCCCLMAASLSVATTPAFGARASQHTSLMVWGDMEPSAVQCSRMNVGLATSCSAETAQIPRRGAATSSSSQFCTQPSIVDSCNMLSKFG